MEIQLDPTMASFMEYRQDEPPKPKLRKLADEMTVLADGTVVKLQKARQRKILSCVHCHSRKVRCSREHPQCQKCQRSGLECKYFINERVSRGGRKNSAQESGSPRAKSVDKDKDKRDSKDDFKENFKDDFKEDFKENFAKFEENTLKGDFKSNDTSFKEGFKDSFALQNDVFHSIGAGLSGSEPMSNKSTLPSDCSSFTGSSVSSDHDSPSKQLVQTTTEESAVDPDHFKAPNMFQNISAFAPSMDSPKYAALSPETIASNVLQAPIINSISNNMTNKFFNTNYDSNGLNGEEHFSFNMSSFSFKEAQAPKEPKEEPKGANYQATNFVDGPTPANPLTSNIAYGNFKNSPANTAINNSLNPYATNPPTTINYLYGTNVHYDNENLLSDLVNHLPSTKERSFDLIDRYVNSVHILLPILVNIKDFMAEHEKYWDRFNPYDHNSPSGSSTSSQQDSEIFDFLQFYTLYFPVLYASTISEFEEYDNLLLNQDIDKYLRAFNKICQHYKYPHGLKTIPLLLGNVIIQSTSPNPSTMEMSQIIRYAKFLQLHKDPLISLRISDWKVVKFRRMLWWVIFGLDALSSHNFCLPPVCRFDDFNVLIPDDHDPVFDGSGVLVKKTLDVSVLAMSVKFNYDRILSELVYHLHNGLSANITTAEIDDIKGHIVKLFHFIHHAISKLNEFYKSRPPTTVQEMNIVNFVKNHSWSFVDRAVMLLHKKILLGDKKPTEAGDGPSDLLEITPWNKRHNTLALSEYEDTFGRIQEANIIKNFDNSSISLLRFNQNEMFTYENLQTNLIPSILHNLNDFLKYNDFIKFGKFNWYIKRTIPLDSIILLLVIMCVKFKYEFMATNELSIYVKLINKALFIFNRKYFKNEKYKRMLSLTNSTWEYIIKKYDVVERVNSAASKSDRVVIEFVDHQIGGIVNMSELFSVMDVPQPALIRDGVNMGPIRIDNDHPARSDQTRRWEADDSEYGSPEEERSDQVIPREETQVKETKSGKKSELVQLNKKIYYDLRNNFVDINDYCTFYSSLENILHELMDYINEEGGSRIGSG